MGKYTPAMQYENSAIEQIDAFLAKSGMSDRQLSLANSKDHKLIRRIREGRANTRTVNKILQFIAQSDEGGA